MDNLITKYKGKIKEFTAPLDDPFDYGEQIIEDVVTDVVARLAANHKIQQVVLDVMPDDFSVPDPESGERYTKYDLVWWYLWEVVQGTQTL